MPISNTEVRSRSLLVAGQAGVALPEELPLLDATARPRAAGEMLDRMLALHGVVAASFGFERAKALEWIKREGLTPALADGERRFLETGERDPLAFRCQVEGIWTLAWALGLVEPLNFWAECDPGFVMLMPNLMEMEPGTEVRSKAAARPLEELLAARDLAYCLHWAIDQAENAGAQAPEGLTPDIVIERRRALEWLMGTGAWDGVALGV